MQSKDLVRLNALIEGIVQGVGFRYFVYDMAVDLGVTGWVRNRWNGDVEVLVEGEQSAVQKLLAALYRGPRGAVVTGVTPEWLTATGEFNDFKIRPTIG